MDDDARAVILTIMDVLWVILGYKYGLVSRRGSIFLTLEYL